MDYAQLAQATPQERFKAVLHFATTGIKYRSLVADFKDALAGKQTESVLAIKEFFVVSELVSTGYLSTVQCDCIAELAQSQQK